MNTRGKEDRLDFQPDIKGWGEESRVKEEGRASSLSVENEEPSLEQNLTSRPESDFSCLFVFQRIYFKRLHTLSGA